jgi:elongation factor 1-alpha
MDISIVIAGNVDAGKSTFIGVLSTDTLDNGNGSARETVARHKHEIESGKTSDISVRTIKNDSNNIILVDLCGHQKYLKTTLYGITGYFPDYGVLVISANQGILKMTREHLGIFLYLNIPFIIIITRIDLVKDNPDIYNKTTDSIRKILKSYRRSPRFINSIKDLDLTEREQITKKDEDINELESLTDMIDHNHNIIPVITISNKTGYYIDVIKKFILNLKSRNVWSYQPVFINRSVFYIDGKFSPKGVGLVVSGLLRGDSIKVGDEMLLGPVGKNFIPIKIWSIHDNCKNVIQELKNKTRGCIAFRVTDKKITFNINMIHKGMIITTKSNSSLDNLCYEFTAKITILNHSTTIRNRYSPVIHCGTVRQTAQLSIDQEKHLKLGDEALVNFRFTVNPEFMEVGTHLFFREGSTRGVGEVISVLSVRDDPNQRPACQNIRKNKY